MVGIAKEESFDPRGSEVPSKRSSSGSKLVYGARLGLCFTVQFYL